MSNIVRNVSINQRLKSIETELSIHSMTIKALDNYLCLLEAALLLAKVCSKEDLDKLRAEVLRKQNEPKIEAPKVTL